MMDNPLDKEINLLLANGKTVNVALRLQVVNALVGDNGSGKTLMLNALYAHLLRGNQDYCAFLEQSLGLSNPVQHNLPVVYVASNNREAINAEYRQPLGLLAERKHRYFEQLLNEQYACACLDEWAVNRLMSDNPYYAPEDKRANETQTLLNVLHAIDNRFEPDSWQIRGSRVSLVFDGNRLKLDELSRGSFALFKMVQEIVAGYGLFTNADNLKEVQGIVLIDDVDLFLSAQNQIEVLRALTQSFPRTQFVVSTHSPLVLSGLDGSHVVWRLEREQDSLHLKELPMLSHQTLGDLTHLAFGLDVNRFKVYNPSTRSQEANQNLLDFISNKVKIITRGEA